ncbi:MAG: endonuclease domain-containing protein [Ignavibacteriales bacterium]|nr:endonuclease domain-containing protein [Ignavibacteriales bacterium]
MPPTGRKFVKYDPKLKQVARMLRKNSTLAEIMLWKELKSKRILGYDFHRQKPVENYVLDFFCPRLNLAIEIDGSSHDNREACDEKRQRELEMKGIKFLRFPDEEIKQNVEGVVEEITEWILNNKNKSTHPSR